MKWKNGMGNEIAEYSLRRVMGSEAGKREPLAF